ncbi:hypothetical protein PACTADRAFT_49832 [Pachysolen tannophilus NRRL Y-2460]|uniref:Glycerol-1-phosphatase n=1 Tax=Pachysolen tannophilus NRRL Y-2460 TaxID=669874 RepID=A0A1E4TXP2_PACTA|nr:hypothetical protein PACTADRAFT_49832 [Pachysolen tannophilus NRRL Y-2460]
MTKSEVETEICLFDLDGTLVLSTEAVERAWSVLFKKHNLHPEDFFEGNHGVRTTDTFKKYLPEIDNTNNAASDEFEVTISNDWGHLAMPLKGASQLINSIPEDRWCIVTSGTTKMAHGWFEKVLINDGISKPKVFITASDVKQGKPNPEGYLKGAKLLEAKLYQGKITKKVVFEDAPAGIKAGLASGAIVIGITSSFDRDVLIEAGANYVVKDLSSVVVKNINDTSFTLEIDHL